MTLSEREQRTLDRIETDCRQDDPGFAVPLDLTALLQNPPTGLTPIRRTPGASQRRSGDDVRVLLCDKHFDRHVKPPAQAFLRRFNGPNMG
jgi:hypothetical protein